MIRALFDPASRRRHLVLAVGSLVAAVLTWRAFDLQLSDREFLQEHGDARYLRDVKIEAHRGIITDRNDEPLAISTPVNSVWVNPSVLVTQPLDLSEAHLKTLLIPRRQREFLFLKRHVDPEIAEALERAAIPGVGLVNEFRRYYPGVEIAAHLIGFTNVDDRGQEGVELAFDSTLRGSPGVNRVIKDRLGRIVEHVERVKPVRQGKDVTLSIDRRLQYVAYRELKKAVVVNKAIAGLMIVLDVNTGEVLALANEPSFNPNNRGNLKDEYFRNRAVTDLFEPGSTIKPFTVLAGLESGLYNATTSLDTTPGTFRVGRHIVRDIHNYGLLDVAGVIEKSSNVGVTKIALSIEPKQLWHVLNEVGFGQLTSVELPSEPSGRLNDFRGWREIEHATLAFGYGMSVTALQLARAYAAIASGGVLRPVSILRQPTAVEGVRVLAEPTALAVRDMLERAVKTGTGKAAGVYGYRVAGKTGTIHKHTANGYDAEQYRSLFAGFIPASAPRLVGVVVIDGPRGPEHYGGLVAAPVFASVMQEAARIFNLQSDEVVVEPEVPQQLTAQARRIPSSSGITP
jgi:cell division protein FtsI (penicillin-binding protein 3)